MQNEFGSVTLLDTPTFFNGMRVGEKISVEIEKGKVLLIHLDSISEPDSEGNRTLFFNLNGQRREVIVKDTSIKSTAIVKEKAEPSNPHHIGATMPGSVVTVLVKPDEKVVKGQPLMVTEAMKMETTIEAPFDGEIKRINVKAAEAIATQDLLIEMK